MWLPNVSVSTTRRAANRKRGRRTLAESPEEGKRGRGVSRDPPWSHSQEDACFSGRPTRSPESPSISTYPTKRDLTRSRSDWKDKTKRIFSKRQSRLSKSTFPAPLTKEGGINFNSAAVDYRRRNNNSASTSAQRGANPLLRCTPAAPLSPPPPTNITILNVNPGRVTFVSARPPRHPPSTGGESCQTFCEAVMCPSGLGFKLPLVCAHSIKKLR